MRRSQRRKPLFQKLDTDSQVSKEEFKNLDGLLEGAKAKAKNAKNK